MVSPINDSLFPPRVTRFGWESRSDPKVTRPPFFPTSSTLRSQVFGTAPFRAIWASRFTFEFSVCSVKGASRVLLVPKRLPPYHTESRPGCIALGDCPTNRVWNPRRTENCRRLAFSRTIIGGMQHSWSAGELWKAPARKVSGAATIRAI